MPKQICQHIRFQGNKYLLIGYENDAAITTAEDYINGVCSYAHLMPNGDIMRFLNIIGTKDDIEFLEDTERPDVTTVGIINLFTHPSWENNA